MAIFKLNELVSDKKRVILIVIIAILIIIGGYFLIKLAPWQNQKISIATSYYEQGLDFENKYEYSNALKKYIKATEVDPNYYKAYIQIARVYSIKGDDDNALAILDAAKAVNRGRNQIYCEIASIYYNEKKYTDALKHVKTSLENGQTSEANLLMAKILFHQDKTADAKKYLSKIGKSAGEYQEAILLKTLLSEKSSEINNNLSKITKKELREYKDNLEFLAVAIDKAGEDKDEAAYVDTVRAYNLIMAQYPEPAITILEEVVKGHPEYFDAIQYLGISYEQTEQNDKARTTMLDALSLNPTRSVIYQVLAKIAYKKKDTNEFTKNYETAIAYAESELAQELRIEYANRLESRKLYTTARKIYEDLIKKNPKEEEENELQYRLYLIRMLVSKAKQYDEAIDGQEAYVSTDRFKNLKTMDEEKASLLAYLGGAKIKQAQRVEGISLCDEALELYPYSAVAYYYKGLSEYDLNEESKAREYFQKAIDYDLVGEVAQDANKLLKSL